MTIYKTIPSKLKILENAINKGIPTEKIIDGKKHTIRFGTISQEGLIKMLGDVYGKIII